MKGNREGLRHAYALLVHVETNAPDRMVYAPHQLAKQAASIHGGGGSKRKGRRIAHPKGERGEGCTERAGVTRRAFFARRGGEAEEAWGRPLSRARGQRRP
jgi:hypothetical protein